MEAIFISKRSKAQREADKRYEAKRAGTRTRNWTAIFYPDDLPEDWKEQLDELRFRWVEGPLHDQDLNADGSPKKAHHHTLLMFESVKNREQVMDMLKSVFGESDGGSIVGVAIPMAVQDRSAIVRYMTHMDNPEKYQYDPADVVGHNGADPMEILRYSQGEILDMMVAVQEFILEHSITEYATLCDAIAYEHRDWYQLVVTKNTLHFREYVRSHRHRMKEVTQK